MSAEKQPSPANTAAPRRRGGVVVPHQPGFGQRAAAWIIWAAITLVERTLRYTMADPHGYFEKQADKPLIFCVWHNRLALCIPIYWKFAWARRKTKGMAAMASASRDGAFLAAVIQRFGVEPVRGSSSRRGPQALLELKTCAEKGYDLAITPDGPRGPRYKVQPGVVSLAQVTGLTILPCTFNISHKIQVKSWDRFQIPLPFSRCEIMVGLPVHVPRDAGDEDREALRLKIEDCLKTMSRD